MAEPRIERRTGLRIDVPPGEGMPSLAINLFLCVFLKSFFSFQSSLRNGVVLSAFRF
jgi:hypothetical protein